MAASTQRSLIRAQPSPVRAQGAVPSCQVSRVAWWTREFPGGKDQVREARRWIEDLLPECEPLGDILLLASEVCANAVVHTRSGQAGRFSVDVEWSPSLARVVVGDQGSLTTPAAGVRMDVTRWVNECGRGLWLVNEMSDGWGTAAHLAGRCVWFDMDWRARGGPPLEAPGGHEVMTTDIAVLRRAWPGTTVWWGHLSGAWWAFLPGTTGGKGLVSAPTRDALIPVLSAEYESLHPAGLASSA
jgi:serine/threonine-protein kinase RsbW